MKNLKRSIPAPELSKSEKWTFFSLSIVFSALIILFLKFINYSHPLIFWGAGIIFLVGAMGIVQIVYKQKALRREIAIFFLTWLVFKETGYSNASYLFLPFVSMLICSINFVFESRIMALSSWVLTAAWYILACKTPIAEFQWTHYVIVSSTLFSILIYTIQSFTRVKKPVNNIDLILSSYSGNTAHYANVFTQELIKSKIKVNLHRFHYYKEFKPVLKGDSLVIAFPVFGWKPPYAFITYLLNKLPRGKGKPAYILYSCAGGPENASFIPWLILLFKGYKVLGRAWGIYPVNVPTVRIGTKKIWKFLDNLIPLKDDMRLVSYYGKKFSRGELSGLPMLFYPFFLWIFGLIIENPLINRLYINYVWKNRCSKCGLCIRYCPAERLYFGSKGYPKSKGASCQLCMSCVNFCPTHAMHIFGWTEYGQPYRSKYYKLEIEGIKKEPSKKN